MIQCILGWDGGSVEGLGLLLRGVWIPGSGCTPRYPRPSLFQKRDEAAKHKCKAEAERLKLKGLPWVCPPEGKHVHIFLHDIYI